MKRKRKKGFTLIEMLVVVAILAVLIGATIVAINPLKQITKANNANRWAGITTIMNAIYQNIIDNGGNFNYTGCGTDIPTTTPTFMNATTTGYNICGCIASGTNAYIGKIPVDPTTGIAATSCVGYDTKYKIQKDLTSGKITIAAPDAQSGETISLTR